MIHRRFVSRRTAAFPSLFPLISVFISVHQWFQNPPIPRAHNSVYDNRNRRSETTRHDGTRWDYGYNPRGEVQTAALKQTSGGALLPGRAFSYAYDGKNKVSVPLYTYPTVSKVTFL